MRLRISFQQILRDECDEFTYSIHYNDLDLLTIRVDGTVVNPIPDPVSPHIALIDIDTQCIEERHQVEIQATYSDNRQGAFSNGFSNGFDITNVTDQNQYKYSNTFTTYGYDLGNNAVTSQRRDECNELDPNPDFTISFASNNGAGFDFRAFNCGFENWNRTYADFIMYREPFSNNIHVYDASVADSTITRYETQDRTYSTRNFVFCSIDEVSVTQTKILLGPPQACGTREEIIRHSKTESIEKTGEHFPRFDYSVITSPECGELCKDRINILSNNTWYDLLDYQDVIRYYRDDVEGYPYNQDMIITRVFDKAGQCIQDRSLTITDFSNYNHLQNPFNFNIPTVGDYIIESSLISRGCNDLRTCRITKQLANTHWIVFNYLEPNKWELKNCSFTNSTAVLFRLNNRKEFERTKEYSLSRLETMNITIPDDGIYRLDITREGNTTVHNFILYAYKGVLDCTEKLVIEMINQGLCCDDCFEKNLALFNAVRTMSDYLFGSILREYTTNYFYTHMEGINIDDLFNQSLVLQKIREHCGECLNVTSCCDGDKTSQIGNNFLGNENINRYWYSQ